MSPKITHGRNYNFYQKVSVSSASFANDSDITITFATYGLILINEDTGSNVIEYSFNGTDLAGELVAGATSPSRMLTFNNRNVNAIWFRVKTGSSGTISVRVDAW